MTTKWKLKPRLADDLIEHLLIDRGMTGEAREAFLSPDYEAHTNDPMLFHEMPQALERLARALEGQEHVRIFADYDADGTCGAAVLLDTFAKIGFVHISVAQPDRNTEGYGLSLPFVDEALRDGVRVLITVDCGVTALEEITYAEAHGISVIVLDHHTVPPVWPPATAILNPKRPGESYPYAGICGTACAFKLAQAMLAQYPDNAPAGYEKWLLDLVAIATVADMVPLTGENRTLLTYGLKVLAQTRRPGLRALMAQAGVQQGRVNATDIGFSIAPRINAASRIAHASLALALLTARTKEEADELALKLEDLNTDRKQITDVALRDAHGQVLSRENMGEVIVAGSEDWNPGILGLVAGRLADAYGRPAFVWGGAGDIARGSCRGGGGVNVVELMTRAGGEKLFTHFGGHAASGGFAIEKSRIEELSPALERGLGEGEAHERAQKELVLDAELSIEMVHAELLRNLTRLSPFGMENPAPTFLFQGVLPTKVSTFGATGNHLRLAFRGFSRPLSAVGFGLGGQRVAELVGPLDIAAQIEENVWLGRREVRLRLVDVRRSEDRAIVRHS